MSLLGIFEQRMRDAEKTFADAIMWDVLSDPNSFVGPKPEWRTWRTHPNEWELDRGGPGQYWLPRFGTRSWIQEKLRYGGEGS